MSFIQLETPRLLLRQWREKDLEPFTAMNLDPQVMRYFPETRTPSQTRAFYERIQQEFTEKGTACMPPRKRRAGGLWDLSDSTARILRRILSLCGDRMAAGCPVLESRLCNGGGKRLSGDGF